MKRLILAAVLAVSLSWLPGTAAAQDNFQVKDATSTTITKAAKKLSDGSLADKNVMVDSSGVEKGTAANPQSVAIVGTPALPAGAATATAQASLITALGSPYQAGGALPLPAGAATDATAAGLFKAGQLIGNTGFAISGTLPAFAATPTVNLGTIGGAATAAGQASMITALGSPYQAGGALPLPTGAATQTTLQAILTVLGSPAQASTKPGVGDLTAVPTGSTAGTLLATKPAAARKVRFYLPYGTNVTFTIVGTAPSAAPSVTFTAANTGASSDTGPNWDEELADGENVYVTAKTGAPLFRYL